MSDTYLDCGVEVRELESDSTGVVEQNRRASSRFNTEDVSTGVRTSGFHKPGLLRLAKVLDVSSGGISIESPSPMSTGQRVELKIDMPVKMGIQAVGRVKYSIRWASSFRVGIEFVEISPADKRLLSKDFF